MSTVYINEEYCQSTTAAGSPCKYVAKFRDASGTLLCGTHAKKSGSPWTGLPKRPRTSKAKTASFIPEYMLGLGERYKLAKPAYFGEELCSQNKNQTSSRYVPCQGEANYVRIDGQVTCARCAHPDQRKKLPTRE